MDISHVDDKENITDSSRYLEGLREHVSNDLLYPFTKVEEKINDCCRRWKEQLQIEKEHFIESLQLGDVYNRLTTGDNQSSSENIQSDIEYFKNVPDYVLQCTSKITTHTDFDRILQYDGRILQSEHLPDYSQQSVYNSSDEVVDGFGQISGRKGTLVVNRQTYNKRALSLDNEISTSLEENVKPFSNLINQVPDLAELSQQKDDTVSADNSAAQGATAVCQDVVVQKHNATDRNWVDILLFENYYLVIIQKKQANSGTNEWLNKQSKETVKVSSWLSLPGAGKMCKVSEKGAVAVLQIGRQYTIAIVKTSELLSDKIELMYRVNVGGAYNAITCLNISEQKLSPEPNTQLKFAAIFSVLRDGKMLEEVDIFYPKTLSMRLIRGVKTYDCKKSKVYQMSGLSSISAITTNKMIVTTNNKVICIDTRGNVIWNLPTPARVTDICCFGNYVFVCLQDKGQILKVDQGVITDNDILMGEHINPSQVSVCGREMLIREFILKEYTSQVIIRIIRV